MKWTSLDVPSFHLSLSIVWLSMQNQRRETVRTKKNTYEMFGLTASQASLIDKQTKDEPEKWKLNNRKKKKKNQQQQQPKKKLCIWKSVTVAKKISTCKRSVCCELLCAACVCLCMFKAWMRECFLFESNGNPLCTYLMCKEYHHQTSGRVDGGGIRIAACAREIGTVGTGKRACVGRYVFYVLCACANVCCSTAHSSILFRVCVLWHILLLYLGFASHSTTSELTHIQTRTNTHTHTHSRRAICFGNIFSIYLLMLVVLFLLPLLLPMLLLLRLRLFEWMNLSVSVFIDDLVLHTRCYLLLPYAYFHIRILWQTLRRNEFDIYIHKALDE